MVQSIMKAIIRVILLSLIALEAFTGQVNADTTAATIKESATSPSIQKLVNVRESGANPLYSRFGKKPKKKDMDRDYLIETLGGGYDTDFLSEEEPEVTTEISPSIQLDKDASLSWIMEHLHKELELLNLTSESLEVDGESALNNKYLDAFKQWLLKKASCPVHYTWKDVGPYFWPRWLKKGACSVSNSKCSWPSGMYCTAAETITIQILRWQCPRPSYKGKRRNKGTGGGMRARGGWNRGSSPERKKCQWIKVPYPITSACLCRC